MAISLVSSPHGSSQGAGEIIAAIILMPIIMLIIGACLGGSIVTVTKATFRAIFKMLSRTDENTGCFVMFLVIFTVGGPIMIALACSCPIVTVVRFFMQKGDMAKGDARIEECNRALAALQNTMK